MNRILMSTVSAVAVAAFASPAMAQLELDVSAYYYFQAGIVDDDSAGGGDDWDFQNEGWVQFNGRGTADNGLTYGFRLDLDDVASNIDVEVDETYLFVQGGFGTVTLGDDDHAADDIAVTVPTAGSGILDGDFSDYTDGGDVLVTFLPEGNTDSTKVKYTSTGAELGGFTVGLSYAPDSGSEGADLARVNGTPAGDFENVVSAGARYSGDFQGFSVSVGAVGYLGDAVAPGADDLEVWSLSATAGARGFEVGANWTDNGDAGGDGFVLGASYGTGQWTVAGNFGSFEDNASSDDETAYGVGVTYDWLPGVAVEADVVGFDSPNAAGDGWVALLTVGIGV